MPHVTVKLPNLLSPMVNGRSMIDVEAATVRGCVQALVSAHPALRVHLLDEQEQFREHVLCFHNDVNTRWLDSLDVPVQNGDTITIMQAVTGG